MPPTTCINWSRLLDYFGLFYILSKDFPRSTVSVCHTLWKTGDIPTPMTSRFHKLFHLRPLLCPVQGQAEAINTKLSIAISRWNLIPFSHRQAKMSLICTIQNYDVRKCVISPNVCCMPLMVFKALEFNNFRANKICLCTVETSIYFVVPLFQNFNKIKKKALTHLVVVITTRHLWVEVYTI
jgi:hypothetical protein